MDLYSNHDMVTCEIVDFLANIEVPKLSSNVDSRPISEAEVLTAIAKLKVGKSPGTDGLTAAFYKKFAAHLVPLLANCFNKAFITKHLTPTQHLAILFFSRREIP